MMRAPVLNLLLGLVLLVVAAVAWWQPGADKPPPPLPRLTNVLPDHVLRIQIKRRDTVEAELSRADTQWRVKLDGHLLPAASWRIENILRLLVAESRVQFPVSVDELPKYELAPSLLEVKFDEVSIFMGGVESISGRRYVLVNGTAHLIEDKIYRQLTLDPMELVDIQLLPGRPDIRAVDFGAWRVARDLQGGWRVYGVVMDVSADAATSFIDEWRYAQGLEVQRLDPKLRARKHLTISTSAGETIRFGWVEDGQKAWILREDYGLMYHVPHDILQRLTDFSPHLNVSPN